MTDLLVDPERWQREATPQTGIYVRAKLPGLGWGNYDIADLTEESLVEWLRSRDSIDWPIAVVKILLGHGRLTFQTQREDEDG